MPRVDLLPRTMQAEIGRLYGIYKTETKGLGPHQVPSFDEWCQDFLTEPEPTEIAKAAIQTAQESSNWRE